MNTGRVVTGVAAALVAGSAAAYAVAGLAEREGAVRPVASTAGSPAANAEGGARVIGLSSMADVAPVRAAVQQARRGRDRSDRARDDARETADQLPYHDYDGQFIFVRVHTAGEDRGFRSYSRIGNGGPGWSHDWPFAEHNLALILRAVTGVRALVSDDGGNILTFDDPRMFLYPIAYVSEPGRWYIESREVEPLREYLLKGGFIIFDDFSGASRCDMCNLAENMKRVLPELDFQRLDGSEQVFKSFFEFDPYTVQLLQTYGRPDWWGLYEDNDPSKRLIAIANNNGDLGENWEFEARGFYTIDLRNEAFKFGVNYIVYAMTH